MMTKSKRLSKTFKKFHSAGRRIPQHFRSDEAEKEMLRILKDNESAQGLAREVASFYGEYLKLYKDSSYPLSRFSIEWGHDPVKLQSVTIQLQSGTNRTVEALTHELLHLRLPIQGFPSCEQVRVPDELSAYVDGFIETIDKIGNLIGHELIYQQFVEFGFNGSDFMHQPSHTPDYEKLVNDVTLSQMRQNPINFPDWCLEFFRHWVSSRHGCSPDTLRNAERAEQCGLKVHSDLPDALNKIREWTLRGEFKSPDKYQIEMNKLLSIMKLPKITGWAALKLNESGKLIAVNL